MHTETLIRPSAGDDVTGGLPTICAAFQSAAARYPNRIALRLPEDGIEWSWDEYSARVRRAAATLHALGIRAGDAVALLMRNRPEHLLADLATLHLGAVPFSLYATWAPSQVEHVLGDSGARALITEPAFDDTVAAVAPQSLRLEHVLRVTSRAPELESVDSPGFDFEQSWRAARPEDVVCLAYTPGTTGPPRGVEVTHANVLANLRGSWRAVPVPERPRFVSFLPLAHLLERFVSHYSPIALAGTVTCCPEPATLPAALADSRPTVLIAPPRVWEKLRAKCQARGADSRAFLAGAGLGELVLAGTGAGPVSVALLEYFQAAGVPLRQVWSMTELTCVGTISTTDPADNGTCGRPVDGLELRIAPDGEVLALRPMVITRYRNLPEQTGEAIDPDGWLHTGDVGRVDKQGRLTVVDRKKDLITNAAAETISPANIEAELTTASPLIAQACVIGNARPYNIALIVLDPEIAAPYRDGASRASEIARGVGAANARLPRGEQIKRYTILDTEWLPGGDELTPTTTLKRKAIEQKYAGQIEAMYGRPLEGVQ